MAQNVLVCCRFRPPSQREIDEEAESVVRVVDENKTCQISLPSSTKKPAFNFDHVFDVNASQVDVFKHTAQPMVKEIMNGYNTTIFAYGQTGSGKTFTMMGDRSSEITKGIIPRLVEAIFDAISAADEDIEFTIKLSYLEIYNERLRDLLNPDQDNLRIRESAAGVWVQDVTESYISSYDEVLEVMAAGEKFRAIAATKMNMESSRSHSVFILTLGQLHQKTGSRKGSKLTLVDLAGSEKVLKTGAEGQTLVEAQHINKSLSSLGNVINALTSHSKHIPYRDSKLTRLLSDSLGGNSKTCLIIACSPSSTNVEETLSTLRFGSRAKMIKNKPTVNQERSVAEYKRLLAAHEATILKQQSYIHLLEEDVDALLKCISAVLPSHLVIPIPILKSAALRKAGGIPHEPLTGMGAGEATTAAATEHGDDEGAETERVRVSEDTEELDEKEGKEPESPRDSEEGPHQSQLDKLEQEKLDLVDQLQDKTREVEDQVQLATLKRNELEAKLNQALKKQEEAELKVVMAEEKLNELSRLQKKMSLMEKEHELQTEQLRADKEELALKISNLSKTDEKAESPRPSRSASVTGGSASSTTGATSPADAAKQAQQAAAELKRLKQNYEAIMRHLKKKCDQYMHLQVVHQDTKEMLKTTEEELTSAKRTIADGAAQKKIKDLETQLEKSEEICKKLFESGKYWRQRRYAQEGTRRIPVPIKGGKKSTKKPEEEETSPVTSGRKPTPEELEETLSKLAASGGPVSILGGKIQRKKSIHPTDSSMDQFF